jgi:hypothetical protein
MSEPKAPTLTLMEPLLSPDPKGLTHWTTKESRRIIDLQINPTNGNIVALCNDGSTWIRSGALGAIADPWKRISDIPAEDDLTKKEENEDDITTTV